MRARVPPQLLHQALLNAAPVVQASIIKDILFAVELDRDAPNREELLQSVRAESNAWVARYRR